MSINIQCECGKKYHFADRFAGTVSPCAYCGKQLNIVSENGLVALDEAEGRSAEIGSTLPASIAHTIPITSKLLCSICQCSLEEGDNVVNCSACHAQYHSECWNENDGCGTYGCTLSPAVSPRDELETPASYWGRESLPCPSCGKEIRATASRCRHCGAVYHSNIPTSRDAFLGEQRDSEDLPAVKRTVRVLFVLCLIPIVSMIAGLVSLSWKRNHRAALKRAPRLYSVLADLATLVGLGQSALLILLVATYALFES